MKSVCITLKKKITTVGDEEEILRVFAQGGYAVAELRVLSIAEEDRIRVALTTLKSESEILLVLADKPSLPALRGYITGLLRGWSQVAELSNAVIYADSKCAVCLLSSDETETGTEFAKNVCVPYLRQRYGVQRETLFLRAIGAGEARVEATLAEAAKVGQAKLTLRHTRRYDEDCVEIVYDGNTPKMAVDDTLRVLMEGFGEDVYALNDVTIEEQLVHLLKLRGKRLSVAESFTGGGVARRITSVSGASEVYFEGINTYDERSKTKRLGVSEYALRTAGVVSEQTAYEMALGLLNTGDCDIAVATTGLAGPKSDRSMLPVGLCFIAVGTKEKIFVYRYKLDGSRKAITEKGINYALFLAYKQLKNI